MTDPSLWTLFFSALISATLFPGGSEALLIYLALEQQYSHLQLLFIVSSGNILGGMSSWLLGWYLAKRFPQKQWLKPKQQKAQHLVKQWGGPVLIFSWLPIIGDPLCLLAGWLRINWFLALIFISLGKIARYSVILFFV
ncbi:MAG: DedA family protein [Gammaproteobacteria bacterium]|nr:DedA family protein [Gammaproteobacteria bacterium]MDH5727801.1 DedA family protein [Gammaproteobacteria bacterium]